MTKIESAAQELVKIKASRASVRAFFSRAIKEIKKAAKQRENAAYSEFFDCALGSVKALSREEFFPSQGGVPFMFEFAMAYISAEEGSVGASLGAFFDAAGFHDFLISETEFLRDFLVIALFFDFLSGDGEQKRRAADSLALLDVVPFDAIYLKYTKVH